MNSDDYAFKAGQTIPGHDWIVVAPIGAGGMGEVYEVRGAHIDRRYVLKTLLKELRGDEMAVKRFYAEAKFLGSMKHEKIVNILATGVTFDEHRQPFFVMEKVYGSTLNVLLKVATKLDLAYACDVFAQIAHALHVVHENGVIHGDVKPLNIMFQQGSAGLESVKLLDFGIARRREGTATSDLSAKMGTPRYTPPEQARCEKLTPAADIYALAVILYEAVTQQYPWPHAITDENQINAHIRVPPQPLESHGDFPPRLCDLVRRSLAKNPLERPQTMAAVEEELKAIAAEIRGLQPKSLADSPTVKRLLTGVQEMGRDDAAPSSSRHRTEESGPPAARAYRANGTSNGVLSELIVGDEGETQDLEPAAPKAARPSEPPPRQRTVRMVLPVEHSPIVLVGAAEQGGAATPAERPAPVTARASLMLDSIVKTAIPEPPEMHESPVAGNAARPPDERIADVKAAPANGAHADANAHAIRIEPYRHAPMYSMKPTEPMGVVVADPSRAGRVSAAAAARAVSASTLEHETAFADALRSASRNTADVDARELPTPPGVVVSPPEPSAPEHSAESPADQGTSSRVASRRRLSTYAAPLVFALIVCSGVLGALAIVRKAPSEPVAAPVSQASTPTATVTTAPAAAPAEEPPPEPIAPAVVAEAIEPAPSAAPSPAPPPATAHAAPAPRRPSPPAAPSASAKRSRPSSGLDWVPSEFSSQDGTPSAAPARDAKGAAAPRASASSAATALDSMWEVRAPSTDRSKKK